MRLSSFNSFSPRRQFTPPSSIRDSIVSVSLLDVLHSIIVTLARLVTAWFMQRNGTAGIHLSNNSMRGGVRSTVSRAHCSYCAYK
jgi:hypothetical protein